MPSLDSFDEEFQQREDSVQKPETNTRVRFVALLVLLSGMSMVGAFAITWFLTAVSPQSDEQINSLMRERDALKKQIGELTDAQQKVAATQATLGAHRGPTDQYWYSDLAALYVRMSDQQQPASAPVPTTSTEGSTPEVSDTNGRRRAPGAPLSLTPGL
jgi:hypothetical protein